MTSVGEKWETQSFLECLLLVSNVAPNAVVGCLKNLLATLLELSKDSADAQELYMISKLANSTQLRGAFKPLLTLILENRAYVSLQVDSILTRSEAEISEITARCEEPRSKQATLASFAPLKATLTEKLRKTSDN